MEYRRIGATDIEVSTVAMGCWAIVGDAFWGAQEESDSLAAIRAALDAGVNFFDTAEAYGNGQSEALLGKELVGKRDKVVLATKASPGNLAPDRVAEACENSLKRLLTDAIDLYQVHWPNREIPVADTMDALEKLKAQGKVRAIGVCNFGARDLGDALAAGRCESNQLPYNLLWRAIEYDIQEKCVENHVGILCYSPLQQGLLTGKFRSPDEVPEGRARSRHFSKDRARSRHTEDGCEKETFEAIDRVRAICERIEQPMADVALAWLLRRPGVASVLAGARNPEQMRENARAAELKLPPDALDELTQATEHVKALLGPNADLWAAESRIR